MKEIGKLIGYKEAAEFLGLPLGTMYSMVHRNEIPHYRISKRLVRFSVEALRDWISCHGIDEKRVGGSDE
ncbi:MAG: helix-turn-helix domain-containing protein [Bacteriovoracaceae bacterium]|jgi:excisionase family DNA binding protein|nr:helix-turn-helix domain-containing protein [Bacteriovoracaceae bacterium]